MGRDNYIGFFIDCAIEFYGCFSAFVVIHLSGSAYVGIALYINGMVKDMKMRIMSINDHSSNTSVNPINQMKTWSAYVQEIDFHIEIIG